MNVLVTPSTLFSIILFSLNIIYTTSNAVRTKKPSNSASFSSVPYYAMLELRFIEIREICQIRQYNGIYMMMMNT